MDGAVCDPDDEFDGGAVEYSVTAGLAVNPLTKLWPAAFMLVLSVPPPWLAFSE